MLIDDIFHAMKLDNLQASILLASNSILKIDFDPSNLVIIQEIAV